MAAVNVTVTGFSQKIPRNTQVAAQEDVWTITAPNNFGQDAYLLIRVSADTLYHSVSGQAATDGLPIPGGDYFPVKLGTTTVFYLTPPQRLALWTALS